MITLRKSADRGHADHGWLKSFHSFSFASYYDPHHIHFRQLRVINEDFIAAGGGFPTHGHDNMEIVTIVISGTLEHKDSMGNTAQIHAGEVQVMSAGDGVTHSEYNPSSSDPLHLFQIWIFPHTKNTPPKYHQKDFSSQVQSGDWTLVVSPDQKDGSLPIDQDALIYRKHLAPGINTTYDLGNKRHAYIHVVTGSVTLNSRLLNAGDAALVSNDPISLSPLEESNIILFDLA